MQLSNLWSSLSAPGIAFGCILSGYIVHLPALPCSLSTSSMRDECITVLWWSDYSVWMVSTPSLHIPYIESYEVEPEP